MEHATPLQVNSLKKNSIGLSLLVFMVVSAAAPLTGIAGAIPIAMLLGNGAGIPGTFIIMAVIMLIWAVGFVAFEMRGPSMPIVPAPWAARPGVPLP